jgi:hypothetical protein
MGKLGPHSQPSHIQAAGGLRRSRSARPTRPPPATLIEAGLSIGNRMRPPATLRGAALGESAMPLLGTPQECGTISIDCRTSLPRWITFVPVPGRRKVRWLPR